MTRKTQFITIGLTLTLLSGALVGCTGPSKATTAADDTYLLTGKVVETMDAAGYTYICIEKDGKKTWAAAPTTKVTVGQQIKLLNGAQMRNFQSKALNRTFDMIIFSGGVDQEKPAAPAAKKENSPPKPFEEGLLQGTIIETMNAANYTYIQIQKGDRKSWAAIPFTTLYVGDEVELMPGSDMGNFNSKTLNRTFANITFSGGLKSLKSKNPVPEAQPKAEAAAPAALPAGHPKLDAGKAAPAAAAAPAAPAVNTITGKVTETMNSGGYTYLCLESEGKKTWAAVPATQAKVGQELTIAGGQAMTKFSSKSLNRTFDSIIFSNGIVTK